ncbi:hypothetical protein WMY93_033771 [Mugilogobius chulae]|uniref:Integrin beta n=1 Tax=Mugilogobius chulae TaxID=88201 RepID=A0AAW0MS96_9GOBI
MAQLHFMCPALSLSVPGLCVEDDVCLSLVCPDMSWFVPVCPRPVCGGPSLSLFVPCMSSYVLICPDLSLSQACVWRTMSVCGGPCLSLFVPCMSSYVLICSDLSLSLSQACVWRTMFVPGLCVEDDVCSKGQIDGCSDCMKAGPDCAWCKQLVSAPSWTNRPPFTNTNPQKLLRPCDEDNVDCQAAFGYRHVLSLTNSKERFSAEVQKQHISGNLDSPEGSLDAMMQATVCASEIGWRNSSTRLLVLATDAGFHMAGDGKLAGILEPNDQRCHLLGNVYSSSNVMDYPSVGQLAQELDKNNIQPIFAVTKEVSDVYKELSKMIPKSEVGTLDRDSGNVVKLITDAYNRLSSKVTLTHSPLPENLKVTFSPKCDRPGPKGESTGVCDDVQQGKEISFDVQVTAIGCLPPQTFSIQPLGIKASLSVTVEGNCDCKCDDAQQGALHPHCNRQGKVECGICKCGEGFLGQFCNCSLDQRTNTQPCERNNGTVCEGRGDCACQRCVCHAKPSGKFYYGKFCECDDEDCGYDNNKLCAGHGECKCGKCRCYDGFEGEYCHCQTARDRCTQNGVVCNGRGSCQCNKCVCDSGYLPPLCAQCPSCADQCQAKLRCVECLGFNLGPFKQNCSLACSNVSHQVVARLDSSRHCELKDSEGCWLRFKLQQLVGKDSYSATILEQRDCPPSLVAIVAASVASVALIGVLLLMLVKLLLYMKDLKEFRKFENEKKKSAGPRSADNPLFKNATTTVTNPTFTGE